MIVLSRRVLTASLLSACVLRPPAVQAAEAALSPDEARHRLAALERRVGGRLGVAVHDMTSGRRLLYRADERFALLSTFKLLAAALVLARVDRGEERLDRRIRYTAADLVPYSPVTGRHVGDGMTLAALCAAAITLSDNTAGNLLLASFGGPAALTAFARSLGDAATRLDRTEPALNDVAPGERRDTTTPAAMLGLMTRLVVGTALTPRARAQLVQWLMACRTGDRRLRAGLPPRWRVGDKTGSNGGQANDVAVAWPPGRGAVLVASYFAGSDPDQRDAVHAAVGRIVTDVVGR